MCQEAYDTNEEKETALNRVKLNAFMNDNWYPKGCYSSTYKKNPLETNKLLDLINH